MAKKIKKAFSLIFGCALLIGISGSIAPISNAESHNNYYEECFAGDIGKGIPENENSYYSECFAGFDENSLIAGGELIGVRLEAGGAIVASLSAVDTADGKKSPAGDAGIAAGDIIIGAEGAEINSVSELSRIIAKSQKNTITLDIIRNGKNLQKEVSFVFDISGAKKIGLCLKDKAAGIGTITFRNAESGDFAALGHGICESKTGQIFPLKKGIVYDAAFIGITKGENGKPGEIKGSLMQKARGSVADNTAEGIYGESDIDLSESKCIGIMPKDQIKSGAVKIICTVDAGGKKAYDAIIEEIIDKDSETKNFIIKVTDPELIAKTGGIVQGMSGSPIIQDGKLCGAVTHVLVSDPIRGYGIFIENMLDAAQSVANENKLKDAS